MPESEKHGPFWRLARLLAQPILGRAAPLVLSQYLAAGLGLATTVVAARALGPTDYGAVALVTAYPNLLWALLGVKTQSVTTRYIAGLRATDSSSLLAAVCKVGYLVDLALSVLTVAAVVATSELVSRTLPVGLSGAWLMSLYAASFPLASLAGTSAAILSSWERFKLLGVLNVVERAVDLALVALVLSLGFGVTGVVLAMAVGQAVAGLVSAFVAGRLLRREVGRWWLAPVHGIRSILGELTTFFGWTYVSTTLTGLVTNIPPILLGNISGAREAGFFRVAVSLTNVSAYPESALARVAYPLLSARIALGDRDGLVPRLRSWTLYTGAPLAVLIVTAALALPIVLPALFGEAFSPGVLGAQLMMLGAAASACVFWLTALYYSAGLVGAWTKAYGLYCLAVLALGSWSISQFGFVGIASLVGLGRAVFVAATLAALRWMLFLPAGVTERSPTRE